MTDATGELLERDAELGTLTALLDAACDGSGAAAMIEGAPGVGKSALLARARNLAADRGMTVLSAQGGEIEREFAWGVVRQLFEPWLAGRSEAEAAELRDETAGLAAPVFGSAPAMGPDGDAFAELHGLFWMAVEVAQCAPVLIAVDDLQWADRPSLRFVVHLAPRLEGLPIALLVTTRPPQSELAGDTGLLGRFLADPAVGHIAPAPLSPAATAFLVRAGLSDAADGAFCEACHETTSGNPFLLVALVDALRADRAHPTAAAADEVRRMTPAAVTRTVLVRLAALPGDCLALARAVAVLGPGVELRLAGRLAGLERGRALPAADLLVRAGILRGDATVDFAHPNVRSAVYHDLTATERGRFHQRAAALLTADGTAAEAVAPHLLATIPDGDPGIVAQLRAAAQQVRARGAREPAVAYLERALAEPPGAAARSEVLLELGAAEALQRPDAAIAHLREALECAGPGRHRAVIAQTLGDALAASGRTAEAIPVLNAGLGEPAHHAAELRSQLEAALIAAARWERSAQSLRHDRVAALVRRAAVGTALHPLLHAQLALETAAAGTDRAVATAHARRVLDSAWELTLGASTVPEVALVLTFAGEADEAWQATRGFLATARRLGWPHAIATASTSAALTALHMGAISEAVASALGAITPGADVPLPRIWPTTPLLLARGRWRAAAGDHSAALEDLMATGERVAAWGLVNPAVSPWRSSAAVSLAAVGDRRRALALADEELALARRWGAPRPIGIAQRAAGLARGDDDGLELMTAACATLAEAGAPVEHARSLVALGAALRRRGARVQARESLRDGLDLAYRCGAVAIAEHAREELVVAGARPRRDALRGRDALTSSELRVARLAADGRTDREIAQLLMVTPRTVETHLTSSYAKLGIRSRRELAPALDHAQGAPGADAPAAAVDA